MEEVQPDAQGDLQARDLGMGYDDTSGYLTGNDTDAPDSDEVYGEETGVPEEIPVQESQADDFGQPGEGDSFVGLGGVTGTERFDEDPRGGGLGSRNDEAHIGDADMRTQEAAYRQAEQRRQDENLP